MGRASKEQAGVYACPKRGRNRRPKKTKQERDDQRSEKLVLERARKGVCAACGKIGGLDPDHQVTRGAGGGEEYWNIMPLCRKEHVQRHSKGVLWLSEKYPGVKAWLIQNGWEFCDLRKRWVHN